jgi:hypothetical protein
MRIEALRSAALGALALGAVGCMDYTIETTIEPDGTGVRVERMEVTRNQDVETSEADFVALTGATAERGWRASTTVDEHGDTIWIFERRTAMRDLGAWSDPSRPPLMLGTTPARAETRLGYVKLGDVAFRSSIEVGVTRRSDGTSAVTYREAFLWDHGAEALVEFLMRDLDQALETRYPRLTDAERGAVVGFARARVWIAGEEGLFFGENEDEAIARAVEKTAEHAVEVVRVRHPGADVDVLRQLLDDVLDIDDEQAERLFAETLPGLNLGLNTSVVVRLTLPGHVTTTNADRRDGNTLEWKFSPLDNLTAPVEVVAEAVIGR